jgi:hypothetical protein
MIANLGGPMAVLMPATLLSSIPVLVGFYRLHRRTGFYLMLAGVGLFAVALVITLTVNVPIDYDINRWTVETLPADWTDIRDRWSSFTRCARSCAWLRSDVLLRRTWKAETPATQR